MLSDGKQIYGRPDGWGGQVTVVNAPEKIEARSFYSIQTIAPLLQSGLEGSSIQLDLLTANKPLQDIMVGGGQFELLEPVSIGDNNYQRIAAESPEGLLTFWIDEKTSVLRRVEFPTEAIEQQLAANGIEEVELIADFENAVIGKPIDDDSFTWVAEIDGIGQLVGSRR